jgi:HlyD family secretion protein
MPIETFFLDAIEGGRVERIFLEAGSMVKKGDPILQLGNTNLQLDVMYREALTYDQINNAQNRRLAIEQNSISVQTSLADVEYQLRTAKISFERDGALAEKGLISPEEFKRSQDNFAYWNKRWVLARENFRQDSLLRINQLSQLETSVDRLEANLDMVRRSIDNLVLRAPISGQLTSLNAEIGQAKSQGERLGQIDVLDSVKVRAAVDEFYIARISVGQTGEFDLAGSRYRLVIRKVFPEVRDARFEVDLAFVGTVPPGIRRGQSLQVRLELGDLSEALLLPRGGFYQTTGGQWVYVVDASGNVATKRPIKLGRQNPQVFEVLGGLEAGERVITSGYENFGDNDKLLLNQ